MTSAPERLAASIARSVVQCTTFAYRHREEDMAAASTSTDGARKKRSRSTKNKSDPIVSRDVFEDIVALQCLHYVSSSFSFIDWADEKEGVVKKEGDKHLTRRAREAVKVLGVNDHEAKAAYVRYSKFALDYVLKVFSAADTGLMPDMSRLMLVLGSVMRCFVFVASDEVAQEGQVCYVTDGPMKGGHTLSVVELTLHLQFVLGDDTIVPCEKKSKYVLCARYAALCYAVWYIAKSYYIVGREFSAWLKKHGCIIGDDMDANAATVRDFVDSRKEFIDGMHEEIIVRYNTLVAEDELLTKARMQIVGK